MIETIKEQLLNLIQNEYNFLLCVLLVWVYLLIMAEFIGILATKGSKRVTIARFSEVLIWGTLVVSIIYAYNEKWAVILFIVITTMKLLSQLLNTLRLMEKWGKVELYLAQLLEVIFKILHRAVVEKIENFVIKKVNIKSSINKLPELVIEKDKEGENESQ